MKLRQLFRSFRYKTFLLTMLLLLALTAVITTVTYWDAQRIMQNDARKQNLSTAKQLKQTLDVVFRESTVTTSYVYLDINAQIFMDSSTDSFAENRYSELFDLTASYRYIQSYIYEIGFYSAQTDTLCIAQYPSSNSKAKRSSYTDGAICDQIDAMQPSEIGIFPHWYGGKYPFVMTMVKKNREGTGATFLNINMLMLKQFMPEESAATCYLIASDGTILYSPVKKQMGMQASEVEDLAEWNAKETQKSIRVGENSKLITSIPSDRYDWHYVSVRNLSELQIPTERISFIALVVVLCASLSIAISMILSKRATKPLNEVMDMLNSEKILANTYSDSEIETIAKKLASLLSSNMTLQNSLESAVNDFNSLQNKALQYQINPHFMFNTLNLISVCAAREFGPQHEVVTLITQLSSILRYSLNTDSNLVPLKEELDYCTIYLKILRKRHRDMFQIQYEIDPKTLSNNVLRLSLQPLIENSIYHGIQPRGAGTITIGSREENGLFKIWVQDDGVGMSAEKLAEINTRIHEETVRSEHIGIINVHRRIQLLFGEEYGVTLTTVDGGGIRVSMVLPICKEDRE